VRRHPERTFTLELQGNYFDSVYVEVDDPDAQIERLRAAIVDQGTAETK
jgi:hypothetical protein